MGVMLKAEPNARRPQRKSKPTRPSGRRPRSRAVIGALDVGSDKICCMIGRRDDAGLIDVLGIGIVASQGIRAGTVVDRRAAQTAIGQAVDEAEKRAGVRLKTVTVNASSGRPRSSLHSCEIELGGREIATGDIRHAARQAITTESPAKRAAMHALPVDILLDGVPCENDPSGMVADRLGIRLHLIEADEAPLRNLDACVRQNHLATEARVASAYAASLACLVDDEKQLGAMLIDMGAGTTSIAMWLNGACVHTAVLSIGGNHITQDIARGLNTPRAQAERLKTVWGRALCGGINLHDDIDIVAVGEDNIEATHTISRSMLVQIIQPRLDEILELVREQAEASGLEPICGRQVVLSGGASQLPDMREYVAQTLGKPVRLGRPARLKFTDGTGLPNPSASPALVTCAGLLAYADDPPHEVQLVTGPTDAPVTGLFDRVGQWFKEQINAD